MQRLNGDIKTLVEKTFEFGDIFLVSNKGHGKTNALEVLASEFAKQPDTNPEPDQTDEENEDEDQLTEEIDTTEGTEDDFEPM